MSTWSFKVSNDTSELLCCTGKYDRTRYSWRISEIVSNVSIQGYYHHKIEDQLPQSTDVFHYKLMKAYVGVSKNSLDIADLDLDLIQTVTSFGSFIKYVVESDEEEGSAVGETTNSALSILMSSQRALCMRRVPVRIARQHLTRMCCTITSLPSLRNWRCSGEAQR